MFMPNVSERVRLRLHRLNFASAPTYIESDAVASAYSNVVPMAAASYATTTATTFGTVSDWPNCCKVLEF
eukprot:6257313-Amphidinium_carterae.2